ncbi:MAG: VWA domain-containing protein, partial [Thermoanaerobaculia bacterium]|nr:VWA domain-containing protein [Thermoanaerobaculia bacterium]
MFRTIRVPSLSLAALLATAAALPAQEPPAARFGETVDVRVVNVEVVVTDREGNPVTGLTRADFELRVDGRPVEISNFYAGERGVTTMAEAAAPAPASPAAPSAAAPALPVASPPARLMVWIDDLSMVPAHRNRILKQLGGFLAEQQARGVDILLARFDRSVEIVRPFGERERPLEADLTALSRRSGSGIFLEVGRRETLREIRSIYSEDVCGRVGDMEQAARRFADPLRGDVLAGLAGLRTWVRSLAGIEGRKALLYVSDGLPLVPGQEAFLLIDQLCDATTAWKSTESVVNDLREVTAAANAAGVTFYTLDAAGLSVDASAADFGPGLAAGNAQMARANLQDSLFDFATETGGRALLDANDVTPLVAGLRSDLETYYSLGFEPAGEPDGRQHRIEVRVARDGLRVRHRSGFTDRPAVERASDRLQASLRFGGESDPLGVVVEAGDVKRRDGKTATLPVRIVVPATKLVFLPAAGGETARVEITLVASDAEGRVSPEQRRTLTVPRAKLAAELGGAFLRFPLELTLRQGPAV